MPPATMGVRIRFITFNRIGRSRRLLKHLFEIGDSIGRVGNKVLFAFVVVGLPEGIPLQNSQSGCKKAGGGGHGE